MLLVSGLNDPGFWIKWPGKESLPECYSHNVRTILYSLDIVECKTSNSPRIGTKRKEGGSFSVDEAYNVVGTVEDDLQLYCNNRKHQVPRFEIKNHLHTGY